MLSNHTRRGYSVVSTVAVHLKLLIHATIRSGTPNFWPPGHVIGYEHTFIGTIADFLTALAADQPFHANFEDALAVQKVLAASQEFSTRRKWISADSLRDLLQQRGPEGSRSGGRVFRRPKMDFPWRWRA